MKQTLITLAVALCCGFAGNAVAAGAGMSKADYKTQKDQITADYKAAKDKCGPLKDNAKDICKAEAKGKYDVAKAGLQEQYQPSPRHEAKVKTEKAEADYKVAKQKCDDSSGNAKDVCKKDAKAAYITAKADAKATKVGEEKGPNSAAAMGARKDANNDTNEAQYTAAKERCDAAFANRATSGPEKDNCIREAKKKFGKM